MENRMHRQHISKYSMFALGLLMLMASVCLGQTTNATVTGEVTEATTGAVLAGAAVSMTNINTGIVSKTVTNNDGAYRISGLEPGVYRANLSMNGFKSVVKNGIELHTEDVAAINFSMQVGAISESVTVEAGAPLVDTQSTSLGDLVDGRQVEEAPLNGRNPMNLLALVPGVIAEGLSTGSPASNQGSNNTATNGYGTYQIGGGLAGWNATFLDGVNVNANASANVSIVPTQDSVGEFRVDSDGVSPQFGGFAGGVVNFSTKSGTNTFHGTAYEYIRNTILDANTFYNDRLAAPVPVLNQNQFGASVGGPIWRNKTFFFGSWEQTRLLTAATQFFRAPTPAEIGGDFTADYGTSTDGIYDFANVVGGAYVPALPETCPGGGINKICPQHLSPAVQQMYKIHYYEPIEPNPAKLALLQSQGYNQAVVTHQPNNEIQYVGRVDHQLTEKQKLFLRYTYWNVFIPNPANTKMPAIPTQPTGLTSQQYVVGDNYSISPTFYADFRVSYIRWLNFQQSNGNGVFDLSQFGAGWAALASQLPYTAPPPISNGDWANQPYSIDIVNNTRYNNYAVSLGLTKVLGHHTFAFGGEARRIETYDYANNSSTGTFNYNSNPKTLLPSTGVTGGIAQLVTGISNGTGGQSLTVVQNPDNYSFYQGYYATDAWQAMPKLTLNLGVRWELPGAWYEKHDHNSVLLPGVANPLGSFANPVTGGATALMGIIAEVNGPSYSSRAQSITHLGLFEPRVGVNYSINSQTVIRGGGGITHPCLSCGATTPDASPLNTATTINQTGFSSVDAPYANGVLHPLGRSTQLMQPYSAFHQTLIGAAVSGEEPNQAYTYVGQWNVNLERSFGSSISTVLAYVGSTGVHLGATSRNLDQLPDNFDICGTDKTQPQCGGHLLLDAVANPLAGIGQPSGKVGGATALAGQFLMPFPEFSGVTSSGKYYGHSSYNALNARIRKHFSAGATVNLSYSWAHFIDNEETGGGSNGVSADAPQDYTNPRADRAISLDDIPNTLTLNYILDLPFGKGKRFLNHGSGVVDRMVSGWSWSGIAIYQSGFPEAFSINGGTPLSSNFYTGTIRPNVVPGVSKSGTGSRFARTLPGATWFNTAAFISPGNFSFGNESRVDATVRADAKRNWDMTLSKSTAIKEGLSLQFRAEYFNVFNHPQYGSPNTAVGASNFGQLSANTGNGSTNTNQPRIGQLSLRLNF